MLKFLLKVKYPQSIWSEAIFNIIKKHRIENKIEHIYDIPGGAGFLSYNLHFRIHKIFHIVDIDDTKIEFARSHIKSNMIIIKKGDLYKEKFKNKSMWMLINSLYLLNNVPHVLSDNSNNIDYIIGVFPYVDTRNYQFFNNKIDGDLNVNEMDKPQTIQFFERCGYSLIDTNDSIYFNYLTYSNNRYVNLILSPLFYLYEKSFKPHGKIYWIGLFRKRK